MNQAISTRLEAKPNILIIDDDPVNIEVVRELLSTMSYGSLIALSGEDGLQLLDKNRNMIDAILLDIMMPGMNGVEVLDHIKQQPEMRDIPVILLTAVEDEETISHCIQSGCFYYVTKPCSFTVLEAILASAVNFRREFLLRAGTPVPESENPQEALSKGFRLALKGANHYLLNIVNNTMLYALEIEMHGRVRDFVLKETEASIKKMMREFNEFAQIEHPTEEVVENFLTRKNNHEV